MNRKQRKLLNSYMPESIINISLPRSFFDVLSSLRKSVSIFKSINTPAEVMDITFKGIWLGDLIYDTYIRDTGCGTIEKPDLMLFRKILEAIFLCKIYEKIIVKYKITHVVTGHIVYNRFGIFVRMAAKHGAIIYSKKGTNNCIVKKYTSMDQLKLSELTIAPELFDEIHMKHRKIARLVADKYLNDRTSGNINDIDAKNAYGTLRTASKGSVLKELGLDTTKPLVFILSHVFSDAPHCNDYYLFLDHYDWAYQTLSHIKNIDSVNWILRDHPANSHHFFQSKNSMASIAKEIYGEHFPPNVTIMPDKQFSTKTVIDMADGIVTGYGTIAIEAASFGIRPLLAGSSPFSGLGFTIDPKNRDEYFSYLQNLFLRDFDCPIDVDKARTAIFIYFVHMHPMLGLIPEMRSYELELYGTEEIEAYAKASEILSSKTIKSDYCIQRLIEYFRCGNTQFINSFDLYDDDYFHEDSN